MKRILNLGAGVGSTTVWLMALDGLIEPFDAAVFADTHGEPKAVYDHLGWLKTQGGPPIHVGSKGDLGEHLIKGVNSGGAGRKPRAAGDSGRFASIPAFTSAPLEAGPDAKEGRVGRQCTREYKVDVVEQIIRRVLFGLKSRQRMPKGVQVVQSFGLHDDEAGRVKSVKARMQDHPWAVPDFPLARLGWTRAKCLTFLAGRVPHPVPRSACVFCPYRSDAEWKHLRDTDPDGWAKACIIDDAIRDPESASARGMKSELYLHRQCIPLAMVDIDAGAAREASRLERTGRQLDLFSADDCVGMCGV